MPNRGLVCALAALAAGSAIPARADAAAHRAWRLASPDGSLTAKVRFLGADAPLRATVRRKREPVLTATIGLGTATRCLPMGFSFSRAARSRVFERYRTPAGKRREHRHLARRLVLAFEQGKSVMRVELQLSDDGFAYRTALRGRARSRLTAECSSFTAPAGTGAWLQRYTVAYEAPYVPGPLAATAPGPIGFPALLRTGRSWALLSESSADRGQPASRLELLPGGVLALTRQHQGPGLSEVRTSWRVAVIGSLATIVESDLVDDLAEPARSESWSWVRPGRAAWSWWADSASPADFERQKQYVDFAAALRLGVRARRRGLGSRLGPGAHGLRPQAPRPGAAVVALGRAPAAGAARRAAEPLALLGRRGREARLHALRLPPAHGLVPRRRARRGGSGGSWSTSTARPCRAASRGPGRTC